MASLAARTIAKFEGFRATAYWDVNHYRVGFGSDTTTNADGSHTSVTAGTTVTREQALADLDYRIQGFQNTIQGQIGPDAWANLDENTQAALTSVAYNYGRLPSNVADAARSGDQSAIADAIESHSGDNNGVNASRRASEADLVRGGDGNPAGGGDGSEGDSADGGGAGAGGPNKSNPCQGMNNFFGSLTGGGAGLLGQAGGALGGIAGQLSSMLGGGVLGNLAQGVMSGNITGAAMGALGQFAGLGNFNLPGGGNLAGIMGAISSGNLGALTNAVSGALPGMLNNLTGGALGQIGASLGVNLGGMLQGALAGGLNSALQGQLRSLNTAANSGSLANYDRSQISALVNDPQFSQLDPAVQQDIQNLQSYGNGDSVSQVTDKLKQHLAALALRADYATLPSGLRESVTALRADVEAPDAVVIEFDVFHQHMQAVLDGINAVDPATLSDDLRDALLAVLRDFVGSVLDQSVANAATLPNAGSAAQMGGALQQVADSGGAGIGGGLMGMIGNVNNLAGLAQSLLGGNALAGLTGAANMAAGMAGLTGNLQGLMGAVSGLANGGNIAGLLNGLPGGLGGAVQGLMSGNIGQMMGALGGAAGAMGAMGGAEKAAMNGAVKDLGAMAGSFNLPLLFSHPCSAGMMNAMASDGLKNAMNPASDPAPARDDAKGDDPPGGVDAPLPPPRPNLEAGDATLTGVPAGAPNPAQAVPTTPAGSYTQFGGGVQSVQGTPNGAFTPAGPRGAV